MFLTFFSACKEKESVTIGYQLMANPWKYLISTGQLDELAGKKVQFKKFNSGAKVINAMVSGDIDIAVAGSTPIAAGLSQGLDIQLLWVLEVIGDAEAFVVRESINELADLKGKKIGVPFGSTTHFHLMLAMQDAGLSGADVDILNLSPSAIVASWKKGEIDGAFVWSPALEELKKAGKVLLSSKNMADKGNPTFDGIIGNRKFIEKNQAFLLAFLQKIIANHQDYNKSPWGIQSEQVKQIAQFVGAEAENVSATLKGYVFPDIKDHPTADLPLILKKTAQFLKQQGKIEQVLDSYQDKIALELIKQL
jgi:taurine transport system substrate-binding protein